MKQEYVDVITKYLDQATKYCENLISEKECTMAEVEPVLNALLIAKNSAEKIQTDTLPSSEE